MGELMYAPQYFGWRDVLKVGGTVAGGIATGGALGGVLAGGAVLSSIGHGAATTTATQPAAGGIPIVASGTTTFPTYGPVDPNAPVATPTPQNTDVVPVKQADGTVALVAVKRRRRRRRKLLTASDKADIAFLQGVLTGQTARAAISAVLSRRC